MDKNCLGHLPRVTAGLMAIHDAAGYLSKHRHYPGFGRAVYR